MNRSARGVALAAAIVFVNVTCVHSKRAENATERAGPSRDVASESMKSGYNVNTRDLCGDGALKFPRVRLGTKRGVCVGLVASADDGLVSPRNIIQYPGSKFFVVADRAGRVLRLDPTQPPGSRVNTLLDRLDNPQGLAIGPDGKVYVGLAEEIIRFDLRSSDVASTVETVIRGFPTRNLVFGAEKIAESNHPLKQFVIDKNGNFYVNVGAPTDNCSSGPASGPCPQVEGDRASAAIWMYRAPTSKVFPALKRGDPAPRHEVYARGLRNSMAIALHPSFPDGAFVQGENARDLSDPSRPNEEINLVQQGAHYGWPYCIDRNTVSPEYQSVLARGPLQNFCSNAQAYRAPLSLMPPHVAPLGATYYFGSKFPDLQGSLVMTWHGYVANGSRLVSYKTDSLGVPVLGREPVKYTAVCDQNADRVIEVAGRDNVMEPTAGAQHEELISEWNRVVGVRPQGAPVGVAVAEDGAIWVVEDKNKTILRLDADSSPKEPEVFACDTRSEDEIRKLTQQGSSPAFGGEASEV